MQHLFLTAFALCACTFTAASQHSFDGHPLGVALPSLGNLSCPHDTLLPAEDEQTCLRSDYHTTDDEPSVKLTPSPFELRALEEVLYKKGPWTSKPQCIAQDRSLLEQGDPDPEPLCLFNDNKFAANRGISFITTPTIARGVHAAEAYTNPSSHDGVNIESNPPFYLASLEGRGIGAIANRTMHRGDKIFSYTPVLVLHRDAFSTIARVHQWALQREAINRLPEYARNVYMALHGHFGGDEVHDIMRTNSFQVYFGLDSEAHNAVLPETSRFNHDCRPNAHYYFDNETLSHHVHAVRTIHSGEELTISYTDSEQPREVRMAAIENSWGFPCSCSTCSLSPLLSAESDRRLSLMQTIKGHLNDYSNESIATAAMSETLVSLYEQERLHAPSAIGYTYAALTHNAFGNVDHASKYAALAIEFTLLNAGPDVFDAITMQELIEDPRAHWSYRMRVDKSKLLSAKEENTTKLEGYEE